MKDALTEILTQVLCWGFRRSNTVRYAACRAHVILLGQELEARRASHCVAHDSSCARRHPSDPSLN
jgi:hypothetical protein